MFAFENILKTRQSKLFKLPSRVMMKTSERVFLFETFRHAEASFPRQQFTYSQALRCLWRSRCVSTVEMSCLFFSQPYFLQFKEFSLYTDEEGARRRCRLRGFYFPVRKICPVSESDPSPLRMMHGGWAPLPSISLLSAPQSSVSPPPLHLLVRWKIGETLFSPFPITQNRPGLLRRTFLHLPIGEELRLSPPWKKKILSVLNLIINWNLCVKLWLFHNKKLNWKHKYPFIILKPQTLIAIKQTS